MPIKGSIKAALASTPVVSATASAVVDTGERNRLVDDVEVFTPPVHGRTVILRVIWPAYVDATDPSQNRPAEARYAFCTSKAQADRAVAEKDGKTIFIMPRDKKTGREMILTVRESDAKALLASKFKGNMK